MERDTPPLGPPPRKARFRRRFRNVRGAYRSIFALVILVFGGWALLDAMRLYELDASSPTEQELEHRPIRRAPSLSMIVGCGFVALTAAAVFLWSERKLRRELNLARHGEAVQGQILASVKRRRKRARTWISYAFSTAGGVPMQGRCTIPRSIPAKARVPGTTIEILYDPAQPEINRARMGLDFVDFG